MTDNERELTPAEKWERATLANNFIFYKVMHNNPDICKKLIEILLERKIDHIVMKQEEELEIDYGKKGIRMDVYAAGEKEAYNLEMQASDTGELPERARYYSSVIDVDQLKSGAQYKDLKDNYIIFICVKDIFHKGLAKYSFENICHENPELMLNDRTYKYFFIAENYDKILNKEQKAFLKLIVSNSRMSDFTEKLSDYIKDAKHNIQWRRQFMDLEREKTYAYNQGLKEGKEEGIKQGIEQGVEKQAEESAVKFLNEKVSPEVIAKCVGITLERVLELQKGIK